MGCRLRSRKRAIAQHDEWSANGPLRRSRRRKVMSEIEG
jgi:hypothetical protein